MLNYGKKFSNFCLLDNHFYHFNKSIEYIGGFGIRESFMAALHTGLDDIDPFIRNRNDWIFGFLSYDLKNSIEELVSVHADEIGFPDFGFFIPQVMVILHENEVEIGVYPDTDARDVFREIVHTAPADTAMDKPHMQAKLSRQAYTETVKKIQQHILKGDCYEVCFCQEFYASGTSLDPFKVYENLTKVSPNPFSAFLRNEERYLMCASPERFLKKTGQKIISQPIKGTAKRNRDTNEDSMGKVSLLNDEKERAENIMIVDLVRNDLSKICDEGTVTVEELHHIYTFPQVHQMVSTISGLLREEVSFADIIRATFPMGSMTGAPKKRAMELIEQYETTRRGLYSGSVGYIDPAGNFDFNVVIRSILYNEAKKYTSVSAGSAITWKSIPEKEYEECLIKMEAMEKALQ